MSPDSGSRSLRLLGVGLSVVLWCVALGLPSRAVAQTEAPPAAAEDDSAATDHAGGAKTTTLMWIIHTSGWIGAVLLAMSIYFVAKVVQLFMELRTEMMMPVDLLTQWDDLLAKRDYQGIYKSAKDSPSELGALVASGLAALSGGLPEAREAVDRQGEVITVELEKKISMLAVIGSLGPMIGLLGTLKGMIASFSVIATSETQLKASEVAGGISEALLITFEGVALSVPAIFLFAVFRNRISTLSLQAINTADEFVRRIQTSAQSRPAAAPAASPQA